MLYIEGIENYTFEGREKYRNISLENYICGDVSAINSCSLLAAPCAASPCAPHHPPATTNISVTKSPWNFTSKSPFFGIIVGFIVGRIVAASVSIMLVLAVRENGHRVAAPILRFIQHNLAKRIVSWTITQRTMRRKQMWTNVAETFLWKKKRSSKKAGTGSSCLVYRYTYIWTEEEEKGTSKKNGKEEKKKLETHRCNGEMDIPRFVWAMVNERLWSVRECCHGDLSLLRCAMVQTDSPPGCEEEWERKRKG